MSGLIFLLQTHIQSILFHPRPEPIHVPGDDLHVGAASIFACHFVRGILIQYWGFWFLSLLGLLCRSLRKIIE